MVRTARVVISAWVVSLFLAVIGLSASVDAQTAPLRLLGEYSFPSKSEFNGTVVGGLSGITYDARRGVYYAVCDDRGEFQPPRFYTLRVTLDTGGIRGVQIINVTTLDSDAATAGVQPYERNDSDLEDVVLLADDTLLISSERDLKGRPWIRRFTLDGMLLDELPQRERFVAVTETGADNRPMVVRGTRTNLGYEGLALSPDGGTLYTANEEALAQDGPIASLTDGTNVRIVEYDLRAAQPRPGAERVYRAEKLFAQPNPSTAFGDNGVSGLLYIKHLLPQFDLLAMERSFATGVGNDVNIYGVRLADAQDVSTVDGLPNPFTGRMVTKTRLVNMAQVGITADNLEGMTLGPPLPNGKASLLVISDDNFSAFDPPQVNQFVLFEVDVQIGK